jgi:L-aminopeptidase/D-esterase-like protein
MSDRPDGWRAGDAYGDEGAVKPRPETSAPPRDAIVAIGGLYLAGRGLEQYPASELCFGQIGKPGKRRKHMAASLVSTSRTSGQLRGVLIRLALAASEMAACYERHGPDQPWGSLTPRTGVAPATATPGRRVPAGAGYSEEQDRRLARANARTSTATVVKEPQMTDLLPLPDGYRVGHWTDADARTGCTVVIPPPGIRGGVDIRGGGTGTRELEALSPLGNAEGPTAVLLTGGSAFGLGAGDGVMRWLEERGLGRPTPAGVVPLVPAAVVFDLVEGEPGTRPGPEEAYAACDSAAGELPERGAVGAGCGAAVGKLFGRDRATPSGVGYASSALLSGEVVAAIAVANAFGDVIAESGELLGAPHDEQGRLVRTADLLPSMPGLSELPSLSARPTGNTTLACLCTDASLDKRSCAIVARMASAGIARAVNPAFTPIDGDVVFCLASGSDPPPAPGLAASWALAVLGAVAATVTATAIRDAVRIAK